MAVCKTHFKPTNLKYIYNLLDFDGFHEIKPFLILYLETLAICSLMYLHLSAFAQCGRVVYHSNVKAVFKFYDEQHALCGL